MNREGGWNAWAGGLCADALTMLGLDQERHCNGKGPTRVWTLELLHLQDGGPFWAKINKFDSQNLGTGKQANLSFFAG